MKHKRFFAIMVVAFTFAMSALIADAQGARAPRDHHGQLDGAKSPVHHQRQLHAR